MIETVLSIALVGFLLWLILTYIPMPSIIKNVLIVFVVVVIVLFLLRWLGAGHLGSFKF